VSSRRESRRINPGLSQASSLKTLVTVGICKPCDLCLYFEESNSQNVPPPSGHNKLNLDVKIGINLFKVLLSLFDHNP
jgi:hypothetical protein